MFCETQHVFTTYPVYLSCIQHSSRLFLIDQGSWVMNGYDKILGEKNKTKHNLNKHRRSVTPNMLL